MSTYSDNLKIEEIGTGEQAGTWGVTTNDNFVNVFEQAIVGRVTVPFSNADVTLTATNSVASQSFRNVYLNCTGTNAASRNLIVPTINKNYVVQNNTTGGFDIVVKTTAGTGITVPNGRTCTVYTDGTNVIQAFDYLPTLNVPTLNITTLDATNIEVTNIKAKDGTASATIANSTGVMTVGSSVLTTTDINGGTIDGTTIGGASAAAGNFTTLGATGVATFSAGTVSDPAITTTGDTNTGMYFPAADTIAFTEGGVESMRISDAGNLGVGTTSPTANRRLDAVVSADASAGIRVQNSNAGTDASSNTSYSNGSFNHEFGILGTGYTTYGVLAASDAYIYGSSNNISFGADGASSVIKFGTGAGIPERMRIDSAGNVGIGVTPSAWGGAGVRALDISTGAGISGSGIDVSLSSNAYYNGVNWIYKSSSQSGLYQIVVANGDHVWFSAASGLASNAITYQQQIRLSRPAANQTTLLIGNNPATASGRNTIDFRAGGFAAPGNQTTGSDGDKLVLYSGINRAAIGIGTDYNLWSQAKSFEWFTSENNSATVLQQMNLSVRGDLLVGANDSVAKFIGIRYSTVPMYMSSSFDGTNGLSTISNNIWNTSNGSYTWSSFSNTLFGAASIQLWSNTSGSFITMGAATTPNATPTGSIKIDKYGMSVGSLNYPNAISGTRFPVLFSNQNQFTDAVTNRLLALDSVNTSGSNWYGLSGVAQYADDWSSTTWQRWVNVSGSWFNAYNLLKESGLERAEYNPGFLYQTPDAANYTGGWQKITYNVAGGTRNLARDGVGYDASSRFTAPCTGWYHFSAQINFVSSNDIDGTIKLLINGNTSSYSPSSSQIGGNSYPNSRQVSGTMYLNEGDYVETWCFFTGNTNTVRGASPYSGSFSGHFVG